MKKLLLLLTIAFFLFILVQAQNGTIQLPATGQIVSYYPGDDGDLQIGVPIPENRFTDHGNGSATDQLTGLMWVLDGNLIATRDPDFDQDRTVGGWRHQLENGRSMILEESLDHIEDQLYRDFIRVHKDHLVNVDHITSIPESADHGIMLSDESSIPVKRKSLIQLKEIIENYISKKP